MTDVLITINKEDYARAKKHMHARRVEYIPGVGIDIEKFENTKVDVLKKRKELGLPQEAKVILSVGELNKNKNHELVINSLAEIKNENIHYVIVGKGELEDHLIQLAENLGVANQLHLLGYRNDIAEIYKAADLYIHPSFREGLPVAPMEAIASGLPVLLSDIRGCRDVLSGDKTFLFCANNVSELKDKIMLTVSDSSCKFSLDKKFANKSVNELLKKLYELKS